MYYKISWSTFDFSCCGHIDSSTLSVLGDFFIFFIFFHTIDNKFNCKVTKIGDQLKFLKDFFPILHFYNNCVSDLKT